MIRVQKKIYTGLEVLQFFTTRNWDFKSHNYSRLWKTVLDEDDKNIFNMRMIKSTDSDIEYCKISILGAKQYICKEPLSTIPRNRIILWLFYLLDKACKIGFLYLCFKWTYGRLGFVSMKD